MGQSESSFQRTYTETVSQLSSVQLGEIAARFKELYGKAGGPRGHVVDREAFSRYFKLPVAVGDRLFDAFDRKKVMEVSWPAAAFPPFPLLLPPYPPCLTLLGATWLVLLMPSCTCTLLWIAYDIPHFVEHHLLSPPPTAEWQD